MMIELKREVAASTDFHFLEALLGLLVGQRCLKVEFSYGDELVLHVGAPTPYSHPKLADEVQGAWVLGARASAWSLLLSDPPRFIESADRPQADSDAWLPVTPAQIEAMVERLAGRVVIEAGPRNSSEPGIALTLALDEGSRLLISPGAEPASANPLADWELFTPYGMVLTCGPGATWSFLRSDVPADVPAG
jgi:hypothetical protein